MTTTLGPATTRIYDLARAVLDAVVAFWPDDASPLPATQYVSNGAIVWDGCELLATSVDRTYTTEGDPALEQIIALGPGFAIKTAVINATLLRCVPQIDTAGDDIVLPSIDDTEASALQILTDAQALTNALVTAHALGPPTVEHPAALGGCCQSMAVVGWTAASPEGGMGGGVLQVRLQAY